MRPGAHSRLDAIEKRLPPAQEQHLWGYVAVQRDETSPTGFINTFTREVTDPEEYDHCIVVEWVDHPPQAGGEL